MNCVNLLGRIGKDCDTRTFDNGSVTKFSLATTSRVKRGDTWEDETEWHDVTAWNIGKLADYLTKGRMVGVSGSLRKRKYTDKNGVERYPVEVVADPGGITLCGGGRNEESGDTAARGRNRQRNFDSSTPGNRQGDFSGSPKHQEDRGGIGVTDDDIPF